MNSRRNFLAGLTSTFGGLALTDLLANEGALSVSHHRPKAKRVIQLFMTGGASPIRSSCQKETDVMARNTPM